MSRDLGRDVPDSDKLYARKLWADFSHSSVSVHNVHFMVCAPCDSYNL